MKNSAVTLEDVEKARQVLSDVAYKTSLVYNTTLSELTGNDVYLKMENLQRTGSFKLRGAYNCIAGLSDAEREKGVIAASAGNHAQGVAFAAKTYGIPCTIAMPAHAPLSKVAATRHYGAQVVLHGAVFDEAYEEAKRRQAESGATFIHPFNDPAVIAGQGTIGMEILDDLPDVDKVVVPIGGGGLIAGVAVAIKSLKPDVKIIGVQAQNMPSMAQSLAQGRPVTVNGASTIADGIAVKTPGDVTFDIVQHYVDDVVTVDEDEIAGAILFLLERAKAVAEGAGASTVAAVQHRLAKNARAKVVALISGGNIDVNMTARIIDKGLVKTGRKSFLTTIIPDQPGTLWRLLQLIANGGANVLAVTHNREDIAVPLGSARVDLELETADSKQAQALQNELIKQGYRIHLSA